MNLRKLVAAAGCLFAAMLPPGAAGQTYPTRPVSLVVPYAPGGITDVVARMVAGPLARELGQPVVVENVTGAGGNVGSQKVAAAAPDGHTLLITQTSTVTNPLLDKAARFHPSESFTHVAFVGSLPLWLLVRADSRWPDVAALVKEAQAAPGKLNYGSGGSGSASHLGVAWFERNQGLKLVHVPYRGMSTALNDLLAGNVDFALTPVAGSESLVQSGRLRPLAITSARRIKGFPGTPTFAEAGYASMDVSGWIGISGPAKLPPAIAARLHGAVAKVLADPQLSAALQDRTLVPHPRTPSEFAQYVRSETARWEQLITSAGIRAE